MCTMFKRNLYIKIKYSTLIALIALIFLFIYYILHAKCSSNDIILRKKSKYRLVVLIHTSPNNHEQRNAIRGTWLSDKHASVKHLFVIGTLNISPDELTTLHSEQQKFNDLLLLPNLKDLYYTLTKKTLYSFKGTQESYNFDYVLKCDDDTYVLLNKILKELDRWDKKGTKKELYWGFFNGRAQVKRTGPWRETSWFLSDYYLPYALGGGYVLSYNLIKFIGVNSEILKLYNSEDVSVGSWLAPLANIERKHDIRFDTEYRSRGCSNQYIITHKQSVINIRKIHEHYQSFGTLCAKEVKNHMSYQYNWTVPPSQCCIRQAEVPY